MRWIITETKNGHKFQFTKFSVTDFFLNDRKKVFQVHSQNRPVAIFRGQKSISVLSREKFFYQSHWIRNFRFFRSSVWPSSPSRQFWTTASVSDTNSVFQCFRSGHNSKKKLDWEWWGLCYLFVNMAEWRKRRERRDVSAVDWWCQTHVKNYRVFSPVFLRIFSGLEILEKHRNFIRQMAFTWKYMPLTISLQINLVQYVTGSCKSHLSNSPAFRASSHNVWY